jgi:hypothetical protein
LRSSANGSFSLDEKADPRGCSLASRDRGYRLFLFASTPFGALSPCVVLSRWTAKSIKWTRYARLTIRPSEVLLRPGDRLLESLDDCFGSALPGFRGGAVRCGRRSLGEPSSCVLLALSSEPCRLDAFGPAHPASFSIIGSLGNSFGLWRRGPFSPRSFRAGSIACRLRPKAISSSCWCAGRGFNPVGVFIERGEHALQRWPVAAAMLIAIAITLAGAEAFGR